MIRQFLVCLILAVVMVPVHVRAEGEQPYSMSPEVIQSVPEGQETVGPYNQPQWAARGKFSSNTEVYVLPPYFFYVDLDYEGDVPRHGGNTDHLFTQEFEIGLPHRFQIAYENDFEVIGHHTQETVQAVEARYAFADWGKIPLNPTLFAEFHFGLGSDYSQDVDPGEKIPAIPDSFEGRILFGQQLGDRLEWALNIFREQELGGEREWETGFAQALSYAIFDEYLKAGAEMEFTRRTDAGSRSDPEYEFDVGPSFTFKPSRQTRFDIAPLFGTTGDSPTARIFMVFSYNFGSMEQEIEGPVSTQNR